MSKLTYHWPFNRLMAPRWYLHRLFGHDWHKWTGTDLVGYTCSCGVKHRGEL